MGGGRKSRNEINILQIWHPKSTQHAKQAAQYYLFNTNRLFFNRKQFHTVYLILISMLFLKAYHYLKESLVFTCVSKTDGLYTEGCSEVFVLCEAGNATIFRCPNSKIFDKTGTCVSRVSSTLTFNISLFELLKNYNKLTTNKNYDNNTIFSNI